MGTQEVALRCTKIIIWTDLVLSLVNQTRARALDQLWGNGGPELDAAWRSGGTPGSRFQVRWTPYLGRARGTPGAGEQLLVDLGLRSPRTNTTALFGELNARSIEMSVSLRAGSGLGAGKGTVTVLYVPLPANQPSGLSTV
ncbi:hypothetical protein FOPG_08059 [Fusarium oxysporum f. sp. conglutinans race 2 54008]|uniref:Uncharacterized protein n=1 Tax=Fusarium oxysporum f. sp. conglutinans race 2 54008 TaxID=1089457 RepID=X0IX02_FUSOX|nr:hypothetical protein FOPG_08059 [Fusarium oxysporum f. sp. conglutinans race 2 54008]